MRIPVIILSAGNSSRLGRPKQLLNYKGKSLLQHTVDAAKASVAKPVIVVLGAESGQIAGSLQPGRNVQVIVNTAWQNGMSSSIKTALRYVQENYADSSGVILAVCDQPFISANLVNALVDAKMKTGKLIVASHYAGTWGTPAFFDAALFPELLTLTGDAGAKKIMMRHSSDVTTIAFPLGHIDIDRDEDYDALNIFK